MLLRLLLPVSLLVCAASQGAPAWNVARSPHFEVYSHSGEAQAREMLEWFEQLRSAVTSHFGLKLADDRRILVFGFASEAEYDPYRLRATADAYYVGGGGNDYIVLPELGPRSFRTAAHEYAHFLLNAAGAHMPPWLGEGLAEVFSTIRITSEGAVAAGTPEGRMPALRHGGWLPLETLVTLPADAPMRNTREGANIFYAESWALTEMLLLSPQYAPAFVAFVDAVAKDPDASAAVLARIYNRPLPEIARDLKAWVRRRTSKGIALGSGREPDAVAVETAEASNLTVQLILAQVLLAAEDVDGAERIYREAALEAPRNASVLGGLATLALARGKLEQAKTLFAEALAGGIADADLCYRYATVLGDTGGAVDQRRAALGRAIALRPAFDDARYQLALLEKNAGNYAAALLQLRAMREVRTPRAYHYWMAMADALIGTGANEEAVHAAKKAAELAHDSDERLQALQQVHIAQTHVEVRFERDASGRQHMVMTRVPNDATEWNPFIEPGDEIHRAEGVLAEVSCGAPFLRIAVQTAQGRVTIAIPDPDRVQMRNAPAEFVCGPQNGAEVVVEYTTRPAVAESDGIARGIEFKRR